MQTLQFDNAFIRELPGDRSGQPHSRQTPGLCWAHVSPTPVAAPRLLLHAAEVADLLDLDTTSVQSEAFVQAFSGNRLLPGMDSYATCYGGHQFGQWAGQLGDGRAIGLGEVVNQRGERWELQLKGAGPTPYSRRADGRAVLRSSLREFLCSEAMYHLGVPTTRALCLIGSGESVRRDMLYDGHPRDEPGAIVCRVAPSFLRFGHFEILAARGETALLQRLVQFTLRRDFPHLDAQQPDILAVWLAEICTRTARLMVEWLRVGFVHGVMNTDNLSILGLTIDYGPYGWVDNFDPGWTPNTTDAEMRRYCFGNQPGVARWNLERLAEALATLNPAGLDEALRQFDTAWNDGLQRMLAGKFGLLQWQDSDGELIGEVFDFMQQCEVDMTRFFRCLGEVKSDDLAVLAPAFYQPALLDHHRTQWQDWLTRYFARVQQQDDTPTARRIRMAQVNPNFVLRNYLAHQAIAAAEQGDMRPAQRLLDAARHPYADDCPPNLLALRPDWARNKPGASMLSCSS